MPNRILREGILTSERIAQLTWPAEVFYRRLMSVVDDFGRFYAKPELLRSAVYPLQFDRVGNQDIGKWLGDCLRAGLVRVYTFDNKEFLELLDFRQQVRAKHSKFPCPPSTCAADAKQVIADAHLDVVVSVVEDVSSVAVAPPVVLLPLIDGTEEPITGAMVAEWVKAFPAVEVPQELQKMRVWCLANPKNRKTRGGIAKFVVGWLGKQQNQAPRIAKPAQDLGHYR